MNRRDDGAGLWRRVIRRRRAHERGNFQVHFYLSSLVLFGLVDAPEKRNKEVKCARVFVRILKSKSSQES